MNSSTPRHSFRWILVTWTVLALMIGLNALPQIEDLGLYYDEAFLAQQARGFVEPDRAGQHPMSVRSLELSGRPFPLRNAAYLGSLKSQLLIPAFALSEANVRVLRTTTLITALLALWLAMLWSSKLFGIYPTIIMGILVACDPSFYFFSQFEWGPFTTNFLCRAAGALLVVVAWQASSDKKALFAATGAGLVLGLGIFSRADFAVILACVGAAIILCRPDLVRRAWREKKGAVIAGFASFFVAALPTLISSLDILSSSQAVGDRGDFAFRLGVLTRVLDGSQFYRILLSGGLFERAPDFESPRGLLVFILIPAALWLAFDAFRPRPDTLSRRRDPKVFLLVLTGLLLGAMLALPGAVRAHHQLNALPLPQLIVACAAVSLWQSDASLTGRALRRTLAGIALGGLILGNLHLIQRTEQEITTTGGRGRFTPSLSQLAQQLDRQPDAQDTQVVSLDWGFHEPLLFLSHQIQMHEPIWKIPQVLGRGQPWTFTGDEKTIYLVHGPKYDLFGIGPSLLVAARIQAEKGVQITPHGEREGETAFYSVRIPHPHTLRFDGQFQIKPLKRSRSSLPNPAPDRASDQH